MDSYPSFFPREPDDVEKLKNQKPLHSSLRDNFPQMFSSPPQMANQMPFREVPIHHRNYGPSKIPEHHFQLPTEHSFHSNVNDHPFYNQFDYNQTQTNAGDHQPRIYNIPIQVEGRDNSNTPSPTPAAYHQQYTNVTGRPQQQHQSTPQAQYNRPNQTINQSTHPPAPPINPHPAAPPSHVRSTGNVPGRVIPIQVVNSSSTTSSGGPQVVNLHSVNQSSNLVNKPDSPQILADPNKVIALGYHELPKPQQEQQPQSQPQPTTETIQEKVEQKSEPKIEPKKVEEVKQQKTAQTSFDHVKEILEDLDNFKGQVNEFNGDSPENKGYKWLDEMLTLCMLRLDCIEINGDEELRKYRKEAINKVNQVFAILETKVSKENACNKTSSEPQSTTDNSGTTTTDNSGTTTTDNSASLTTDNGKQIEGSLKEAIEAASKTPEIKPKKIKIKKKIKNEDKKEEEAGEEKKEEKEKKKFFLPFGKKGKKKNGDGLDPNNNLKGEDGHSITSERTTGSDSTTSSTTTLQGKETAV